MANLELNKIIVWERINKTGKWCPYSPEISRYLEESCITNLQNVSLGEIDESLRKYSIDFQEKIQISETTGTKSQIRRSLYDCLNVLGKGFSWQWHDDKGIWNTYEVEVNNYIDDSFLEGKKSVNLSKKFPSYNYEIVFSKMIQINKHTKRKRKIRRFANSAPYPVEKCSDSTDEQEKNSSGSTQIPAVLSTEYLTREIPGTAALESQVNAYKRNVESPDFSNSCNIDSTDDEIIHASKHGKYAHDEQNQNPSNHTTTVALVNGKPWTDSRPPHTPQSKIKPVPGIDPLPKLEKVKKTKRKGKVASCPDELVNSLEKYSVVVDSAAFSSDEACIICCESLSNASSYNNDTTVSKLTLCSHIFHKACLEAMYNSSNKEFLQCPTCKKIHGEKCGMQPPGDMIYHVLPYSLPGYPDNDTIRIIYDIHSGVQGPNHPNPGHYYTARGFPRHCYLPDNEIGRKVLRLLVKAWKRRLIFTIGSSSTTGEENTVTWNEIHHKTEFGCNRRGHGYPDPNYFDNVIAELEAHGVIDDEERIWVPV